MGVFGDGETIVTAARLDFELVPAAMRVFRDVPNPAKVRA